MLVWQDAAKLQYAEVDTKVAKFQLNHKYITCDLFIFLVRVQVAELFFYPYFTSLKLVPVKET